MKHEYDQTLTAKQTGTSCPTGLCSVGLMKSFCPSCMLVGLLMLPFEIVIRALRRVFAGRPAQYDAHRFHAKP